LGFSRARKAVEQTSVTQRVTGDSISLLIPSPSLFRQFAAQFIKPLSSHRGHVAEDEAGHGGDVLVCGINKS